MLGVKAGVSIFDLEDSVRTECERTLSADPRLSFDEVAREQLMRFENKVYYRTISPRHFETAAFRVCQVLFEGKYSGVLQPMQHYIPVRKDIRNFDDVLRHLRDRRMQGEIVERTFGEIIVSDTYSYRRFVQGFDHDLLACGFVPTIDGATRERVTRILRREATRREFHARVRSQLAQDFPGRSVLKHFPKPLIQLYQLLGYGRTDS